MDDLSKQRVSAVAATGSQAARTTPAQSTSALQPTHAAASPSRFPEFSDLVLACRHRKLLTLVLGVAVSAALVVVSWRLTTAPYEATSLVRVRRQAEVVFTPQTSRAEDIAFVRAQEQLAQSPQVLAAALHDEQLAAFAACVPKRGGADWLKEHLQFDIQEGAEVMSISARHASPDLARALANAVTQAYLAETTHRLNSDRQRRYDELGQATRRADARLDELWAELNAVAAQVGSDNSQSLTIRDEIRLQAYREYAQRLRAAQLRGNELQSLLTDEQLKDAADDSSFDAATAERLRSRPEVVAAQEEIAAIDMRIAEMREIAVRDDAPRLTRLYEDRAQLAAKLEEIENILRPQIHEQLVAQQRTETEQSLEQLKRQIELNQAEKDFLHQRMEEIDTTVVRTDKQNGVQLEMARHAVDRQTRLADALSQSLEELKIESNSSPRVTLIESAPLPDDANHSRQLKAAAGAVGVGWLIAVLCAGSLEWRSCCIRSGADLRAHSTVRVFGANEVASGLFTPQRWRPTEGAREAAARLMLANNESPRVPSVLVTSAVTNEPRHLVSLELAQALRSFQRRTLLIDCDTNRGTLTRSLGAAQLPGLRQACADRTDPRQFLRHTEQDQLDFLPLGLDPGDEAWIDPQRFQAVIRSLRLDYPAIVVNGPAIVTAAECLLLASHLDQTLLTAFRNKSRWDHLVAGEQAAQEAGVAVLGTVFHGGQRSAKLKLRPGPQGTSRCAAEPDVSAEQRLRAGIAEMQQELNESKSHESLHWEAPANREPTS